jgi:hypothetical protein
VVRVAGVPETRERKRRAPAGLVERHCYDGAALAAARRANAFDAIAMIPAQPGCAQGFAPHLQHSRRDLRVAAPARPITLGPRAF